MKKALFALVAASVLGAALATEASPAMVHHDGVQTVAHHSSTKNKHAKLEKKKGHKNGHKHGKKHKA
jgi:Ni/Co efflux regulator RcnB